jgi:hypothetical protein
MNHVVFFRFNDATDAIEAAVKLNALLGVVPTLDDLETGVDELRTDRSWDLCLITRFADKEAMEAYQVHPAHQEVVAWIKARAKAAAAVDWT